MVQLGLGLIGIGREWGVKNPIIPTEKDVFELLDEAYNLGIRYFNTAPAYGYSEERFGKWYKNLTPNQQKTIIIATKFGEFWNFETNTGYKNYSYQNLKKSIDKSFKFLGKINILQVHGFTKDVWDKNEDNLIHAFDYAQSLGINKIGASLSNPDGAEIVIKHRIFEVLQFPHNITNPYDQNIIENALANNKNLVINRPFAMGKIAQEDSNNAKLKAYTFIMDTIKEGIILTGTKSIKHLKENVILFNQALEEMNNIQ